MLPLHLTLREPRYLRLFACQFGLIFVLSSAALVGCTDDTVDAFDVPTKPVSPRPWPEIDVQSVAVRQRWTDGAGGPSSQCEGGQFCEGSYEMSLDANCAFQFETSCVVRPMADDAHAPIRCRVEVSRQKVLGADECRHIKETIAASDPRQMADQFLCFDLGTCPPDYRTLTYIFLLNGVERAIDYDLAAASAFPSGFIAIRKALNGAGFHPHG